jgi:hypothetical protein
MKSSEFIDKIIEDIFDNTECYNNILSHNWENSIEWPKCKICSISMLDLLDFDEDNRVKVNCFYSCNENVIKSIVE